MPDSAQHELQQKGSAWVAWTRLATVTAFLFIASIAGLWFHQQQWSALLPLLSAYWVASVMMAAGARREGTQSLMAAWAVPFLDVPVLWALDHRAMSVAPSPDYVVGWSIGLFLLSVLVATLTFQRPVLWTSALTGAVAQGALVIEGHMGPDLVATSVTLLGICALVLYLGGRLVESSRAQLLENERARISAEERAHTLRREQQAVRAWTEMAVHDLKQPLTVAILLAESAASALATGAGAPAEDLVLVNSELRRMDLMVGDLVMMSRLEQGELKPSLVEHETLPLLTRIGQLHAVEARARGVSLEVEGDPLAKARVDMLLVQRAVENLLANAFRFVHAGDRIRLTTAAANGAVTLSVQNSGPPVRPDLRPALFRGRFSEAGDHLNAGLGLYFCRLVAEAHGGSALLAEESTWSVEFRLQFPA